MISSSVLVGKGDLLVRIKDDDFMDLFIGKLNPQKVCVCTCLFVGIISNYHYNIVLPFELFLLYEALKHGSRHLISALLYDPFSKMTDETVPTVTGYKIFGMI